MSKRWMYVEARDVTLNGDVDQWLSFDSVIVVAENEDEAYRIGPSAILQQRGREGDEFAHGAGRLLNDYVVEIPEG